MKISGFSYVRNGIELSYPFVESIKSILPICDEFIMVVGDSHDGSREAVEAIQSDKIKIIDSVWNMNLRVEGGVFAQQSNIGLDNCTGDWLIHIQADEVIHEDDLQRLKEHIYKNDSNNRVQGLLMPYYHFWGGFNYIRTTRHVHRYEIRVLRNLYGIRSFNDSQGFRIYPSKEYYSKYAEKGRKLKVKLIDVPVYHYKRVLPPTLMRKKMTRFFYFYKTDEWMEKYKSKSQEYNYQNVDALEEFKGTHPKIMEERVKSQSWEFVYDPKKTKMKFKYWILFKFERLTGIRLFEYRNYKLIN